MDFNLGEVVRHKATNKRCVVVELQPDGYIRVTTSNDESKVYLPHELKKSA